MLAKIKENRTIIKHINRFAEVHDFVVFGKITKNDHIERVRGATFTAGSSDSNYMHANINDYETTFFTRTATHNDLIHGNLKNDWTVLSVELKAHNIPHVIFDNKKHDKRFYRSVYTKFPKLRLANQILTSVNFSARQNYDIYMSPDANLDFSNVFDDEILQRMTYHYGKFDVEVSRGRLTVFSRGLPSSYNQINEMLEEALWLAERISMRSTYSLHDQPQVDPSLSFVPA